MENMEQYKKKVKENIEELININELEEAKKIIKEYEQIVSKDVDIYSMKSIIAIVEEDIEYAEKVLQEGLEFYPINFDIIYNLGYLYEFQKMYGRAYEYYEKAFIVADQDNKSKLQNKITDLEDMEEVIEHKLNEKDNIDAGRIIIKMKMQIAELKFSAK